MRFDLLSQFAAKNLFALDASWFEQSSENSAYLLWQHIRDATNILVIIIILLIVFSQLTGLFIDNYGIKKMLPKLVVAIIAINLSFFICALAVDLSNIIGYGILGWLSDVQGKISIAPMTPGAVFASVLDVIFGVGAGAISVIASLGTMITTLGGPVILIGLGIALLVAVVAILFVFLLLGAREIMCMALVAISPFAFFCLILPNTQKLFTKWLNAMKSLLMIYPIIASFYGGAKIIRVVIIQNSQNYNGSAITGFLMLMIGCALPFVPFFLIPSILKKALGAVAGGLEKIKNAANKGIHSAQKGFQNSNWAQQKNAEAMKNRFDNGRLNKKRREMLNKAAQDKFKLNYDQLSDEQKKKLGFRASVASANLAAAGKRAEAAQKQLTENSRYADKDYVTGSMNKIATENDNLSKDMKEYNNDTISAMDVGMYDENGRPEIDEETGKQKTQEAFYDRRNNSWKVDTGKKDENGNAIYKTVSQKQMDDIRKAQYGKNPNKVRIGKNGEKEFTLNKKTGKYENAEGKEATEAEMNEIKDNLAKGKMLHNYTRQNGRGNFTDSLGKSLKDGEDIAKAGFSQSWGDLQRAKADEARARARGDLIGGYAGQNSVSLANASQLSAENEAMSRTNIALGQADALRDMRNQGYNTTTSRIAGAQSAGTKLFTTMQGNVSAMEVEMTAGVQALMTAMLTVDEKAKLTTAAKAGKRNLEAIITDANSSEGMKQVAREMLASGKDYSSFGATPTGSKDILSDINNIQSSLMKTTGTVISSAERQQLIKAGQSGTSALRAIAESKTASNAQKAIARAMIHGETDYTQFVGEDGGSLINESIQGIEDAMMNGKASDLSMEQKEKLVKSAKAGTLARDYFQNHKVTASERLAALKIQDSKFENPNVDFSQNGYGSDFIKGIIDGTSPYSEFSAEQKLVQPAPEQVLSVGRTSSQIANAISAGSTRLTNQFETQIAGEKAGEVKIDRAVTEHRAQNAKVVKQSEQDAYADILNAPNDITLTPEQREQAQEIKDNVTTQYEKVYNQAQRKIFTTAAQNMLDVDAPKWETIKGDVDVRRANEEIKAKEAEFYNMKENGKSIIDSIPALQTRLLESARSGRESETRALINILSKKGENGQEAVHQVLATLSEDITSASGDARTAMEQGQYTIASHIVNNYGGEYKNSSRSTFDRSQAILSGGIKPEEKWDGTIATNIGSLKPATFAVANDAEVDRYIEALNRGLINDENHPPVMTEEQVERLGNIVSKALNTDTIRGTMKDSQVQRFEKLLDMAKNPNMKYSSNPVTTPAEGAGAMQGRGGVGDANSPISGLTGSDGGRGGGHNPAGGPPGGGFGGHP